MNINTPSNTNIYGPYQTHLNDILDDITGRLKSASEKHRLETGEALFEHINGRVKHEDSMI